MVRYLYRFGNQETCRDLAVRLIDEWTAESGPDYDRVLDAQRRLGDALRELGQYHAAYAVTEATLKRSRATLGEDNPLSLALRNGFAADMRARGEFAEARSLDEGSLALHHTRFGDEHGQTFRVMHNLALDHALNSDYEAARNLHQRTFLLRSEAATGVSPSEVLMSWNGLARAVRLCGNFTEARDVGEDAFDYGHETLGAEHYWTLRTENDLSIALRRIATAYQDALELADRCLRAVYPDLRRGSSRHPGRRDQPDQHPADARADQPGAHAGRKYSEPLSGHSRPPNIPTTTAAKGIWPCSAGWQGIWTRRAGSIRRPWTASTRGWAATTTTR